jgi:hypothetical protein
MHREWIEDAQDRLCSLQQRCGGWSYSPSGSPAVEPTALAGLGLLACPPGRQPEGDALAIRSAADWLAALQQRDGSLGVSAALPSPCWPTPYAILFWAAAGGHPLARKSAARWLLATKGTTVDSPSDGVIGHDTTLAGWPWVADTHSWLEPTAMAVLALRREGLGTHPRSVEGLRLIRDRAIASGGWNYGNSVVFGRQLRPQPAPTGLALLALAGVDDATATVRRATRYLQDALPSIRSPISLGWGLLGLRAWDREPHEASDWLAEAAAQTFRRPNSTAKLALLLLAAGELALDCLGLSTSHIDIK